MCIAKLPAFVSKKQPDLCPGAIAGAQPGWQDPYLVKTDTKARISHAVSVLMKKIIKCHTRS